MRTARVLLVIWLLAIFSFSAADAQPLDTRDNRTLELVDQLKELIQRAERSRNPDPALLQQLRDLVRRYDWPWRARLLSEDFTASNYRLDSRWSVDQGDFRVQRGAGLRTVFTAPERASQRSESSGIDLLGGIIRGMTDPGGRTGQSAAPAAAEIYTELAISNAFAISVQLDSRAAVNDGRLEMGPYRGRDRASGYRLAYNPGKRTPFELLRLSSGRSAVIEVSDGYADLEDGRAHAIEWRRGGDGQMTVLLDGKEIIRSMDRASGDSFDGFTVVNTGGEYTISRIDISGTDR